MVAIEHLLNQTKIIQDALQVHDAFTQNRIFNEYLALSGDKSKEGFVIALIGMLIISTEKNK